jgi:hypothetical protein
MGCLSIVSPPAYPGEIFFATISDSRMILLGRDMELLSPIGRKRSDLFAGRNPGHISANVLI